jgi:ATP-dependent helicase/nuclease subunit B
VQARFLLGPAGSGKTFRCLAEVRAALANHPDGDPLVLLAPKQATFQLERQLLAGGEISGFTRLQIFSFDRLAQSIFARLNLAPPKLLSGEGRLMVLRALLMRHESELKLFGRSARRLGFAAELSALLSELQQQQFAPAKLRALAGTEKIRPELQNKLRDLALLAEKYAEWLREHGLHDADNLPDFAAEALRAEFKTQGSKLKIEGLWLDGFAEMTPQELDLLAATVPFCERATLAFCLENEPAAEPSRPSIWSAISKTFQQCHARVANLPGCKVAIKTLKRGHPKNRFAGHPALQSLEQNWAQRVSNPESRIQNPGSAVRAIACADPEAEAVFAAREVLKFVRAGNRFRDCAVLVRQLENYHQPVARVFRRYEIPFFLDRREAAAHHPLAELTRSALRTIAFDWQNDDFFAALKAGFCVVEENEIDALENAALESGWRGKKWRAPLPDETFERFRKKILPPFENFHAPLQKLKFQPDGKQLAESLRGLWDDLDAGKILENWMAPDGVQSQAHLTVWKQMNSWLDNLALAFPHEQMGLRDWLPVLEAGLANLAVGVVPIRLDEVLIGAVDRARNPDLKFTLVLGVNESVFPAVPGSPAILTNGDRDELENQNAALGPNLFDQISRERFLGYIACTRAREKLAVTFSRQSADGKTLGPSPFIAQLQNIFPALAAEEFSNALDWRESEHASELVPPLVKIQNEKLKIKDWESLLQLGAVQPLAAKLAALREPDGAETLLPALAEKLYGAVLKTSVSRLEEFAQCPFKFFIHSGLSANERKVFELDARARGSFQHEVLEKFHNDLVAEKKRWRDLAPMEARQRAGQIADELAPVYREGLLHADHQNRFTARALTAALQDFVETLVTWMRGQYEFDPAKAEAGFGLGDPGLPAWEIILTDSHRLALRGRIDRIDLCRDGDRSLAVVMDYKSSARQPDKTLIEHGVQLQLPAYLAALRRWPAEFFGAEKIIPAGVFYVSLRGQFDGGSSRAEVLADGAARRTAYRHSGRFDSSFVDKLDRTRARDQFNYQLNKDGGVRSNSVEAISRNDFDALLDQTEAQLRALGKRIFSGAAAVDPYRKGSAAACDFCDYRAACRIDPWTHQWRVLRATETKETL